MPQHLSVQGLALQDVPRGVSADAPGFRAWVRGWSQDFQLKQTARLPKHSVSCPVIA